MFEYRILQPYKALSRLSYERKTAIIYGYRIVDKTIHCQASMQ